jgi:hypothetical protein
VELNHVKDKSSDEDGYLLPSQMEKPALRGSRGGGGKSNFT